MILDIGLCLLVMIIIWTTFRVDVCKFLRGDGNFGVCVLLHFFQVTALFPDKAAHKVVVSQNLQWDLISAADMNEHMVIWKDNFIHYRLFSCNAVSNIRLGVFGLLLHDVQDHAARSGAALGRGVDADGLLSSSCILFTMYINPAAREMIGITHVQYHHHR